ncbi:hypothetical protein [uncultured Paraglaciecola sp.]|uniref:hypothetical protein n=1 Tax=uncultured Paraglaciecola sp. TaxID=1765024 RepID=UPI00261CA866|nr:hypothetical protein [uncultured Paraglaciecola sp.]
MNAETNNIMDGALKLPPLMGYAPVQLATPQLIESFWPLAAPLLSRCVNRAMHGEYQVEDLKVMVETGRAVAFVITNDPTGTHPHRDAVLAWIVEPVAYPRMTGVNIVALGGTSFGEVQRKFFDMFKGWAFMNGAKTIEASVSPAMARMLAKYGYTQTYVQVRCDLTETVNDPD